MPTTHTTGTLLRTTTTRTTATMLSPSSHLTDTGTEHVTLEEVFDAYFVCRKHKRNTVSALKFEKDYITGCYRLWQELNSQTYRIGTSVAFCVSYPKLREVFAADFRDRIVHHLIINKLNWHFEQQMLESSFACRTGKGTLYGVKSIQESMKRIGRSAWYAKCDISGFFMSIDRDVLMREIERIVRESGIEDSEWWLWLLRTVVMNRPERNCDLHGDLTLWNKLPRNKSLFHSNGKGLPIGNLTSQVFANVYLSMFDRWIAKEIGEGGEYGRYVDDFIVCLYDKKKLLEIVKEARLWLSDNLKLTMHPQKQSIQQVGKGVRFTGVHIVQDCLLPSKRLVENTFRMADDIAEGRMTDREKIRNRINSRLGLMVHYNSWNIRRRIWRRMSRGGKARELGIILVNHKKLLV